MREKQLKEFLRGELNSIAEGDINSQSINEIVSSLWEKSGRNFSVCERLISNLPSNIAISNRFKSEGLTFLHKIGGSVRQQTPVETKSNFFRSVQKARRLDTQDAGFFERSKT